MWCDLSQTWIWTSSSLTCFPTLPSFFIPRANSSASQIQYACARQEDQCCLSRLQVPPWPVQTLTPRARWWLSQMVEGMRKGEATRGVRGQQGESPQLSLHRHVTDTQHSCWSLLCSRLSQMRCRWVGASPTKITFCPSISW